MYRAASASGDSRTLISIRGDRQQIERRSGSPTLSAHTAKLNSSHLSQERLPAEGLHGTGIHGDPLGEAGTVRFAVTAGVFSVTYEHGPQGSSDR
jgi:hypothetical protein